MGVGRIINVVKKETVEVVNECCKRCSVCDGRLLIQEKGNGFERRIACESYENHKKKSKHKGYTDWFSGQDSLGKAIDQWNEINE